MRVSVLKSLLAVAAVTTLACSSGEVTGLRSDATAVPNGTPVPAAVVIVPPASTDITVGQTLNLVASVKSTTGQDISSLVITWSTSDPLIATVSPAGIVTANRPGTVVISGSASGRSASITLNVKSPPISTVIVSLKNAIQVGESITAAAIASDASGNTIDGNPINWSSTNPGVAIVSATGVVIGISAGTTTINANVAGVLGSAPVTVTGIPVVVSSVSVSLSQSSVNAIGLTSTAVAVARDQNGTPVLGKAISWSSSNPSVASISQLGVITSVASGSTTITATVDGRSGTATFVVSLVPQAPVASVTLSVSNARPSLGATVQVSAVLKDAAGITLTNRIITWTSSSPAVATVTQTGDVTGTAVGTATITATSENIFSTVTITVVPAPVTSLSVGAPPTSIQPTETTQLVVTLKDASSAVLTGRIVTYQSSLPAVATVSSTGLVTGIAKGTTNITVTSEGVVSVVQITIPPVARVTVGAPNVTLQPTQSTQATVAMFDNLGSPATNRQTVWASSVPTVATVSATGVVTAIARGTTVVSVTSEGVVGNLTITVPPVTTINVTAPSVTLQPGGTTQAAAALLDASGAATTNRVSTWSSSNPAVATVSASGLVTAIAMGSTNITVTSEGVTGSLTITVPPVTTISVTAPNATALQPTQTSQGAVALLDANGTAASNRQLSWASSNPAAVTVTSTGLLTGVAPGTSNITVTSEGVTGTLVATVPPVATVTVALAQASQSVGGTTQGTATLRDANNVVATNRAVAWSSGTPSVATVSATGLVTAVATGTSAISATSEGKTGSFTFTVAPPGGSITVTAPQTTLLVSDQTQLTAVVRDLNGNILTSATPVWTSSDSVRAPVTQSGLVRQASGGPQKSVTISARSGTTTQSVSLQLIGHPQETIAALPQVFLNSAVPAAPDVGGVVITVASGGNLQAAINAAQPGDVIELVNGAVFTGNFSLPNKGTSTKWITIRPQNMSQMPAPGNRMTPTLAALVNLPKIQTPNSNNAISTFGGAHHYRLIGLELMVKAGVVQNYAPIALEANNTAQNTLALVPHNFVLDRLYIHGNSTLILRRCLLLNSASTAVIDSDLRECHDDGSDSQAIAGYNGPGPYKIVNNYLEGAGENIIFGGSDPAIANLVPSDIEIRRNHFYKPPQWKGSQWLVKNHLELKNSQRVLIEGNIFENNWGGGQDGTSIIMKSVNQNNTCPWCGTQDVTFRYNIIRNVGSGFNLAGSPDGLNTTVHARRMTITDNLVTGINTGINTGAARAFVMNGDPANILIAHNTVMSPGTMNGAYVFGPFGASTIAWQARDNITDGGSGGLFGDNFTGGTAFARYAPAGSWVGNVMVYGFPQGYPTGNAIVNSYNAVGFTSPSTQDFSLSSTSPFKNAGTDGRDPGADLTAVASATAGVIVP